MKQDKNLWLYLIIGIVAIFLIIGKGELFSSTTLPDTASVYCQEQGGKSVIGECLSVGTKSEGYYYKPYGQFNYELIEYSNCQIEGNQRGYCFINGEYIEYWKFYNSRLICCGTPNGPYVLEESCSLGKQPVSIELCQNICLQVIGWTIESNKCISKSQHCGEIPWFYSLKECEEALSLPPITGIACYYIEQDKCLWKEFKQTTVCPTNYYNSLKECEDNLPKVEEIDWFQQFVYNGIKVWHLLVGLSIIIGYLIFKKK